MTAVIVDDAMFMRKTLRLILEKSDIEVIGEAENGVDALEKIKRLKPDVASVDITMPEMDGLELLTRLKEVASETKVVMVSAMGQKTNVVEALKLGAAGFIVKPFKEEDVIGALKALKV